MDTPRLARPVASDPVAAKAIEVLTAILAGSRNDPWYRELARNVAESFFDHVRIRTVRSQIFYNLGEFENADPSKNASAANQLERIWRYEQRVLAKRRRSEHWIVVRGAARVTVNELVKIVHENESIYIPIGSVHRLENPGKILLELIEVQTGSYLGEDDIIRIEHDYQRS
jgi:mannose-6-phosphate isomerase-like protein (cupin superfamily)